MSKTSLQFFFMANYDVDRFREFIKSEGFKTTYDVEQETLDELVLLLALEHVARAAATARR